MNILLTHNNFFKLKEVYAVLRNDKGEVITAKSTGSYIESNKVILLNPIYLTASIDMELIGQHIDVMPLAFFNDPKNVDLFNHRVRKLNYA